MAHSNTLPLYLHYEKGQSDCELRHEKPISTYLEPFLSLLWVVLHF
jgi:hypothetical protein